MKSSCMIYVSEYQRNNGLLPDGVIGPKTLRSMLRKWSLTKEQLAHLLGQTDHETGRFSRGVENFNYTPKRMLEIFRKDFDTDKNFVLSESEKRKAQELYGNPEKIANFVYANQNGNGNEASGDGWKYRGRGAIMVTGKGNYLTFAKYLNDKAVVSNPERVEKLYFFESAIWYFHSCKLLETAKVVNAKTIKEITYKVNGGFNGLIEREEKTYYYYELLKTVR